MKYVKNVTTSIFLALFWSQATMHVASEPGSRFRLIADAISTEEGRLALGQAMQEPIRRSLEYQAVGRRLLMIDELPQNSVARYETDVAAYASLNASLNSEYSVCYPYPPIKMFKT